MPLALLLVVAEHRTLSLGARGLALGIISGAVTSGLGYAVWYRALAYLTATRAAVVQLSVPVVAGLGAVLFLGETLTSRLVVSALAILGGIAIFLGAKAWSFFRPTARGRSPLLSWDEPVDALLRHCRILSRG